MERVEACGPATSQILGLPGPGFSLSRFLGLDTRLINLQRYDACNIVDRNSHLDAALC